MAAQPSLRKSRSVTPVSVPGFSSPLHLHYKLVLHDEAKHHWELTLALKETEDKKGDAIAETMSLIIRKELLPGE